MDYQPYTPPEFKKEAFNCPFCNAYAKQNWLIQLGAASEVWNSTCHHCWQHAIWYESKMLYPDASIAPLPNPDLPEEIRPDYEEARSIVSKSPRGAAALLRLCIQKLCKHLGEKGKYLNEDIGSLVSKGLPERIQQALDIVRVTGNNAVHPGVMDLKDNPEIAIELFKLVNIYCGGYDFSA